jgi:hypothetical protein
MNAKSRALHEAINNVVDHALEDGLSIAEVKDALYSVCAYDDEFGLCPICHRIDGYANAGRSQHFYCKEHKMSWCLGSNILSSWRKQTEEEQRKIWNEIGLDEFEDVQPYFYTRGDRKPDPEESEIPF